MNSSVTNRVDRITFVQNTIRTSFYEINTWKGESTKSEKLQSLKSQRVLRVLFSLQQRSLSPVVLSCTSAGLELLSLFRSVRQQPCALAIKIESTGSVSAAASALAGKTQRNRRVIAVLASGGASLDIFIFLFFQVKKLTHFFPVLWRLVSVFARLCTKFPRKWENLWWFRCRGHVSGENSSRITLRWRGNRRKLSWVSFKVGENQWKIDLSVRNFHALIFNLWHKSRICVCVCCVSVCAAWICVGRFSKGEKDFPSAGMSEIGRPHQQGTDCFRLRLSLIDN